MSRSSIYESVYKSINEFKGYKKFVDTYLPDKALNAAELASAGVGVGGLAASATGVGAAVGVPAMLASSVADLGLAAARAARGEWGAAGLNLLGAIPVVGDIAQGGKLVKAGVKAADASTAVKGFKQVETPMVTPRPSPKTPSKPRTTPGRKETTKPIEEPDVSTITKDIGIKPATKLTSGLGKVTNTGVPAVSRTSRILSSPVTQGAIAAGAGAALGSGIGKGVATSVADLVTDEPIEKLPKESLPIPTQAGDPGFYQLGAFSSTDPSSYAKSITTPRSRDGEVVGYNPFVTMPVQAAMQTRRRNVGLPESVEYNTRDVLYKKAYSAVNRYLRSTEGRQLNNHISDIKKGVAE